MDQGKFIVFEGIDNSGKTTISRMIQCWLDNGNDTILTRHPGSTPIGTEIRNLLKHSKHPINPNAQALMFAADNSAFMHQILQPSLQNGTWVLADRNNYISSLAYQIASGCSLDELDRVHDATLQTNKIDLLFVFTCSWEETRRRKRIKEQVEGKQTDRYEDVGKDYFDKLVECYDGLINNPRISKFVKEPIANNVVMIDATQDMMQVYVEVENHVRALL